MGRCVLASMAAAGLLVGWAGCSNGKEEIATPGLTSTPPTGPTATVQVIFYTPPSTNRVDLPEAEDVIGTTFSLPAYVPEGLVPPDQATLSFEGDRPLQAEVRYSSTGEVPSDERTVRDLEIIFFSYDWQSGFDEAIDVRGTQVLIGENVVGRPVASASWLEDGKTILVVTFGQRASDSEVLRQELLRVIESMVD